MIMRCRADRTSRRACIAAWAPVVAAGSRWVAQVAHGEPGDVDPLLRYSSQVEPPVQAHFQAAHPPLPRGPAWPRLPPRRSRSSRSPGCSAPRRIRARTTRLSPTSPPASAGGSSRSGGQFVVAPRVRVSDRSLGSHHLGGTVRLRDESPGYRTCVARTLGVCQLPGDRKDARWRGFTAGSASASASSIGPHRCASDQLCLGKFNGPKAVG